METYEVVFQNLDAGREPRLIGLFDSVKKARASIEKFCKEKNLTTKLQVGKNDADQIIYVDIPCSLPGEIEECSFEILKRKDPVLNADLNLSL